MDYIILYSMQGYYLCVFDSLRGDVSEKKTFILKSELDNIEAAYIKLSGRRPNFLSLVRSLDFELHKVLFRVPYCGVASWVYKKLVHKACRAIVAEFRLDTRERLFERLSVSGGSLRCFIDGYTSYTYHEVFTLWVYNEDTKTFTFVDGSAKPRREFVGKDEETTLNDAIDPEFDWEVRQPFASDIISSECCEMKSVTRISLTLGPHKQRGLLSFYSCRKLFGVQKEKIKDIRSLVEMKYLESLTLTQKGLENVARAITIQGLSDIPDYFHVLTKNLCRELEYEAASAFIWDQDRNGLSMISTCSDSTEADEGEEIFYPFESTSLTNSVLKNPKSIRVIYDLNCTDENSHIYDEPTMHDPVNWIGVPVNFRNECFIVLRMKNKYRVDFLGERVIIPPRPTDHFNILSLLTIIESQVENSIRFYELSKKLEMHDNLAKVYRHEIRGPASSIVTTPHQLVARLEKKVLTEEDKISIIKQLYDLESLAENLSFVARSYSVEALIAGEKRGKRLSLLQDLIFPIEKITKRYFRNKYCSEIRVDHDSMRGGDVYGEQELYNMVIYALLDNAGKYQELERGDIVIYAKYKSGGDFVDLYVENYGLEIRASEVDRIFESNERGEVAQSCKIDGSGIGLWLCRSVLQKYGGDIGLDSRFDPVRFKLRIPRGSL